MSNLAFFRQPCQFMAGVANIDALPDFTHPEIAFIGRSNVGKSSLLNALVGQNALARTSQNPGRTQQLNFFLLGGNPELFKAKSEYKKSLEHDEPSDDNALEEAATGLMLVDMPGYGYAKVSKTQKSQWDHLIRSYLSGRPNLKRACMLIDARRGIMPHDESLMELLDEVAVIFQIIVTKSDTLKKADIDKLLDNIKNTIKTHAAAHPEIILTSAKNKHGIEELQEQLAPFVI